MSTTGISDDEQELREALADIEHVQAAFDQQQPKTAQEQQNLNERRRPFDMEAERLRARISVSVARNRGDDRAESPSQSKNQKQFQANAVKPTRIVTKAQQQKLMKRIKASRVNPELKPKGMPPSSTFNVERDLRELAANQAKLEQASQKTRHEFKRAAGRSVGSN